MYSIRSIMFEKHGRIGIGLSLFNSSGLSFLYNGITFVILSLSGTIPVCNLNRMQAYVFVVLSLSA